MAPCYEDDADDARNDTQRALQHAAAVGDARSLLVALENGAAPEMLDDAGFAAIHRASAGGHVAAIARLLENKVDANFPDLSGSTALHHACTIGSDEVVSMLLAVYNIHANAANADGSTSLMVCALHNHTAIAERLLRHGADACITDRAGGTALMRACGKGHVGVASLLLARAVDLDVQDSDGESALHAASYAGRTEIVALLLQHGASAVLLSASGHTAAQIAHARGHDECASSLKAAEADATSAAQRVRVASQAHSQTQQLAQVQAVGTMLGTGAPSSDAAVNLSSEVSMASAAAPALITQSQPVDLVGDGGVLKALIQPSPGAVASAHPLPGATVRVHYTMAVLEPPPTTTATTATAATVDGVELGSHHSHPGASSPDGTGATKRVVARSNEPYSSFLLCDAKADAADSPVPHGVHVALRSMCRGERASVNLRADYGYGRAGEPSLFVPPHAPMCVLLELVDWMWPDGGHEALAVARDCKARGGECFGEGRWEAARQLYERGVGALGAHPFVWPPVDEATTEAAKLHIACLSNQTMCLLRLREWASAAECASAVLAREPSNAKGLYRRGLALLETGDPRRALADLKMAAQLEPRSHDVRAAYVRAKEGVAGEAARERRFGGQLAAAIDGYHDDVSADALADEVRAEMAKMALQTAQPAGAPTIPPVEIDASMFQNERIIADARADGHEGNLMHDPQDGTLQLCGMMEMGGTADGYRWGQSDAEVIVLAPVPLGTRSEQIVFELTSLTIRLGVLAMDEADGALTLTTVLDGDLHAPVVADECTYQLEPDEEGGHDAWRLSLSLAKLRPTKANQHWPRVVVGGPQIDVAAFGEPVIAINENSSADIAKYMRIVEGAERGELPREVE